MAEGYRWKLNSINNVLQDFEYEIKTTLYTDSFTIIMSERFAKYLKKRNLMDNSIRDILLKTQSVLNRAKSEGYYVVNELKHVMPKYAVTPQIYLNRDELEAIYSLSDLTKTDELIRDMFILSCYTGLRLSDLFSLRKEHMQNDHIVKMTLKTSAVVKIPLGKTALEILSKYNNELPRLKTSQNYNAQIKKICKEAGITEPFTQEYRKGGKIVSRTVEKWRLVRSHTGRRTFVTNLYLVDKVDLVTLANYTGHTSIENLIIYIRASSSDISNTLYKSSYLKR